MKKSRPTLAHDMDSTSKTEDVVVITEMGKLEKQRKQAGRNNLNPAITSDRNRAVLEEKTRRTHTCSFFSFWYHQGIQSEWEEPTHGLEHMAS